MFMQDGSRIVRTRAQLTLSGGGGHWNVIREQHLDPKGLPLWTTDISWRNNGRPSVSSNYGTVGVTTTFDESGRPTTTMRTPTGTVNLGSKLMGHPTIQQLNGAIHSPTTGGALSALDKASEIAGMTKIGAGAKYGGFGLATALALGDVVTADYGQETCEAVVKGPVTIAGGWAGGAVGALVPVPYLNIATAGGGAALGGMAGQSLGEWLGEQLCNIRRG